MIVTKIEETLIEDLILFTQKAMITSANLGVFKKESQQSVVDALNEIRLNSFINIQTQEEYDTWFDQQIINFHQGLLPYYREDLKIQIHHPYIYSARLFTQYMKFFCFRTYLFEYNGSHYLHILHPIISNHFIGAFPNLGINKVGDIQNREQYYGVISYFRYLLGMKICNENEPLLSLEVAVDY